jgi:ATP adenylyltransferase
MTDGVKLIDQLRFAWQRGLKDRENRVIYEAFQTFSARDKGIPFEIRYLPSLEKKASAKSSRNVSRDASRDVSDAEDDAELGKPPVRNGRLAVLDKTTKLHKAEAYKQKPKKDPFAPPRDNVIKEYNEYTLVLNIYPLEELHFLCVTNEYIPQVGPLRPVDLAQMWNVLCELEPDMNPYGFFNGGEAAGASQHHRHMQFMHFTELEAFKKGDELFPDAIVRMKHSYDLKCPDILVHPGLSAAHFLIALPQDRTKVTTDLLAHHFMRLHQLAEDAVNAYHSQHGSADAVDEMPYNLLMTSKYVLILPRRSGDFEGSGVGGTCLVGCLCVERPSDVDKLLNAGFDKILEHVGIPWARRNDHRTGK